jgi:probable addiction module antidote protein/putative addiction module killer protein
MDVRYYITKTGRDVVDEWIAGLADRTEARILARIERLSSGNFGDRKALGGGLFELRIDTGPGYRVYCATVGRTCVLLPLWRGQTQAIARHSARTWIFQRLLREDTQAMKDKTSESHDEVMRRRLRANPKFAAEYLKAALEDTEEPAVLLIALRRIAEARGGIAKVAKVAGIERESLYRALSARGNPRLSTLVAVTKAVGLKLTVETAR